MLFGKSGGSKTMKASEALEEALCFGRIDGPMQSNDGKTYKKYFSMRRQNSNRSEKNKSLVESLKARGVMTDFGRKKVEEAHQNGQWGAPKTPPITEAQDCIVALLEGVEPAHTHYQAMSASVKKHMRGHISVLG